MAVIVSFHAHIALSTIVIVDRAMNSTLALWRRAAKVIALFSFLLY